MGIALFSVFQLYALFGFLIEKVHTAVWDREFQRCVYLRRLVRVYFEYAVDTVDINIHVGVIAQQFDQFNNAVHLISVAYFIIAVYQAHSLRSETEHNFLAFILFKYFAVSDIAKVDGIVADVQYAVLYACAVIEYWLKTERVARS